MRGWWQDLTDLVLPAECGGCGKPRTVLCPTCRAALSGAVPRRVRPVSEPPGLPVVHAAARYADEVRATLLAHKERGALALAAPLGVALAGAVRAGAGDASGGSEGRRPGGEPMGPGAGAMWGDETVVLVPVPSARRAVRARGHDPARRIALVAARELRRTGTPARVAAVLRQRRAVADQAGLNSRERLANLAGALAVVGGGGRLLAGGPVVLVDDLMTTGASLAEAARAVRVALAEAAEAAETTEEAGGDVQAGAESGEVAYRGPAGKLLVVGGDASVRGRQAGVARDGAMGVGEPAVCGGRNAAVYAAGSRESREERMTPATEETARWVPGRPEMMVGGAMDELIYAAVVAATPDSFEINRN
ncbi:putative amidophosphoribosyltransferase [Streptomyces sp. LBL]|uniref:ComF family protein n=1 Tax=Streptomyces sp. LBL TaxID=2940562 RepID=UPI002474F28A|nr:ComF family protein [Streptomyces sp. LBL]MDH6629244.1 putative amidophosphoribosyltransferase [Streptomyces sp. LBL]